MNNRVILMKKREAYEKGVAMRGVVDPKCPFETAQKIRKKQDEYYKKYKFYEGLQKAMEKSNGRSKGNSKKNIS